LTKGVVGGLGGGPESPTFLVRPFRNHAPVAKAVPARTSRRETPTDFFRVMGTAF